MNPSIPPIPQEALEYLEVGSQVFSNISILKWDPSKTLHFRSLSCISTSDRDAPLGGYETRNTC